MCVYVFHRRRRSREMKFAPIFYSSSVSPRVLKSVAGHPPSWSGMAHDFYLYLCFCVVYRKICNKINVTSCGICSQYAGALERICVTKASYMHVLSWSSQFRMFVSSEQPTYHPLHQKKCREYASFMLPPPRSVNNYAYHALHVF